MTQGDLQRYIDWCAYVHIPRVTVFTHTAVAGKVEVRKTRGAQSEAPAGETVLQWVRAEDGVQRLVDIAKDPKKMLTSVDQLRSAASFSREKYRAPDLLVSIGPSRGMPLDGLPPLLAGSAEVLYGGRRLSVLDFYAVLEQFARIEQRFGK